MGGQSHRRRTRIRIGTYAIGNAVSAEVDGAEPLVGEDGGLREAAGKLGLVEPGKRIGEGALIAQHLLESPQEGAVPHDELAVVVHIVGHGLVDLDEVLVAVLGARVVALGRPAEQALDAVDKVLLGGVGAVVPLGAGPDGAASGASSEGAEVGFGGRAVGLVGDHLGDVGEREGVDLMGVEDVDVELGGAGGDGQGGDGEGGGRGAGGEAEDGELGHCGGGSGRWRGESERCEVIKNYQLNGSLVSDV